MAYTIEQKIELLIKLMQVNKKLRQQLTSGDDRQVLEGLAMVGLTPKEVSDVYSDDEKTGKAAASVWVPTS